MKTLEQQINELKKIAKRKGFDKKDVDPASHNHIAYDMGRADGKVMLANKALIVIEQLQKESEKLKEVIGVVDICLSDYEITEHGLKIINEKDLKDAEDTLKQIMKEFK